jgi:hypothetical protein
MPRSSDDDDARWELPVWEPPSGSPLDEGPRWEPDREVPRWQPRRESATRPRGKARAETVAAPRAPAPPKPSLPSRAATWWGAHPWVIVWALVILTPAAAVLLRALDESGLERLVRPLAWTLGVLLVVALAIAMMGSARRSVARLALGTVSVLIGLGAALWPVTQVTLGRTACPARASGDLGAAVAGGALDAWQRGVSGDGSWRGGQAEGAWQERARVAGLLDYQLVETGCWERAAPIDASRTWHEFRVTVHTNREDAPLSKSVVVHTATGDDGWKITAIEGPLP